MIVVGQILKKIIFFETLLLESGLKNLEGVRIPIPKFICSTRI
jgi:hypothetical protein